MNTDTTTAAPAAIDLEPRVAQPITLLQGGREVSVFEKAIDAIMRRPDANLDQLQQMMQMHERWEERQAEKAFVEAMATFKLNPPKIIKDKSNGYTNRDNEFVGYMSATLAAVCEAAISGLAQVGISHKWTVEQTDGQVAVSCVLTHRGGHSEAVRISAPADTSGKKNAIQAIASSVSYLERYTLLAATGLAAEDQDDDGKQHKDAAPSWEAEYTEAINLAQDLATLQAAWKTAAGACRRKGDVGRPAYDRLKDLVLESRTQLGITPEQWAAATKEIKP